MPAKQEAARELLIYRRGANSTLLAKICLLTTADGETYNKDKPKTLAILLICSLQVSA
jgi:hypothetical protein